MTLSEQCAKAEQLYGSLERIGGDVILRHDRAGKGHEVWRATVGRYNSTGASEADAVANLVCQVSHAVEVEKKAKREALDALG